MPVRLGEVMVKLGLLTNDQVKIILKEQRELQRPFGELAERMFGVDAADVERSWAQQYSNIADGVDPRGIVVPEELLSLVTSRQAWQFRVLPIRNDGSELVAATVIEHLPRALRFALRHFRRPTYFLLAEPDHLGEALMKHYPIDGFTAESVVAAGFEQS